MKICVTLLMSLFLFVLASCASTTTEREFKGQSAQQIFTSGQQAFNKHKYDRAIRNFEALNTLYPFGPYNQKAQYDLITAYYNTSNSAQALAAADRYIRLYPRSADVDYAYYMKGIINYGRGRNWLQKLLHEDPAQHDLSYMQESSSDFNQLIVLFPDSQYVQDARKRIAYIHSLLAQHALEVAKFYFDRKVYVAAANRADGIVKQYQGSVQVLPALGIMVKSYRALGQTGLANDALKALARDYPNSKLYRDLQRS